MKTADVQSNILERNILIDEKQLEIVHQKHVVSKKFVKIYAS